MEKQVVLSESELGELIQKEVNKAMRNNQKTLFSAVSVNRQTFLLENARHEASRISYHVLNCIGEPIWVAKLDGPYASNEFANEIGEPTHENIRADVVHDLLRKLSLAVYGVKRNKDLQPSEQKNAVENYKDFANLYLELYRHRLNELDKED